jgi:hypothetical protein
MVLQVSSDEEEPPRMLGHMPPPGGGGAVGDCRNWVEMTTREGVSAVTCGKCVCMRATCGVGFRV